MSYLNAQSICNVLNSPGLTLIEQDTVADPDITNDSMYCIEASDVILDLGGFTISQDPADPMPGFTGITVSPGLSNIIIRSGTIQGMTGSGIVIGEGCTNVTIEDITILECNASGIILNGNLGNTIKDGSISNCYVYSCTGVASNPTYGLRLIYCDNIVVQDSTFNRNDASTVNNGYGISAEWCTTCRFTDCEASANGGNAIGVGINIYNSEWSTLENCKTINNISRSSGSAQAVGFLIDTSNHTTINQCLSKHNNNAVAQAYGFHATNGSDNILESCQANQNTGGTKAAGFLFDSNEAQSSLLNCLSILNNGGASGDGYGILLDTAQHCDILFNNVSNNTGSTGVGLEDTVINTTNLIAGTIAFNNTTTNYQVTRTSGTFPVVTASLGDFSATTTAGIYVNIDFM